VLLIRFVSPLRGSQQHEISPLPRPAHFLHFPRATIKLLGFNTIAEPTEMLLSRDYVGYMAAELAKRLIANKMIEIATPVATLAERIRLKMAEELGVEDRLNEEVREILNQHADEMRRTGVSYQEMFKKVKGELARQRKLTLR
jgi:hypothetical protein